MNSGKKAGFPGRLAVRKTVSNMRKFKSVSDSKLNDLKIRWLKKRTFNKMQWGVHAYNSWRQVKLENFLTFDVIVQEAYLDEVKFLTKEALCYALCRFIPEVTKCNGQDYPGKSLYDMVVSIQKFLNQNNLPWKLIEDPEFLDVKTVLDNIMKERAVNNVGLVRKQAEVITPEYEEKLWVSGVLGEDTPDKLRETVLFVLGINLALRAGDEHYDLRRDNKTKPSQISFERDVTSAKRCLVYREDTVTKTNDGGLSNLKKERKVVWVFPSKNVNRCPVRLVDKYVSLCPEIGKSNKANFYLRSLEKPNPAQWYGDQPVGRNTLAKVVKKLLKSVNLNGYFTNHSLRRMCATRLFQAGVDSKIVREITGHSSDALNKYQITSNVQKANVSDIIKGEETSVKKEKKKRVLKSPEKVTPSLEILVKNTSPRGKSEIECSCK